MVVPPGEESTTGTNHRHHHHRRSAAAMVPSPRRHLQPVHVIHGHGGSYLTVGDQEIHEQSQSPPTPQQQQSHQNEGETIVEGISIHGWKIRTSQGPMADASWLEQATAALETLSQPTTTTTTSTTATRVQQQQQHPHRQLALPEMIFPSAQVEVVYDDPRPDDVDVDNHKETTTTTTAPQQQGVTISINAMDFLQEWAELHQQIPLPDHLVRLEAEEQQEQEQQQQQQLAQPPPHNSTVGATATAAPSSSTTISATTTKILEISHASLWKEKKKRQEKSKGNDEELLPLGATTPQSHSLSTPPIIGSTTFHYDWTYSSPYGGRLTDDTRRRLGGMSSLPQSGMPLQLLTDTRAPILLFDQIVFVEDDLHDNGQIQFSAKIRVMPTCLYILTQLFVRVDHVLIRVRETRWMVHFTTTTSMGENPRLATTARPATTRTTIVPRRTPHAGVIYRDVTWRECPWQDLATFQLPTNVQAWTQNEAWKPHDAAAFAQLLQKIPTVDLPSHLSAHSQWVL